MGGQRAVSDRVFRETQEEKEGKRGVPFEEEGEEERERHIQKDTQRVRQRERRGKRKRH